jgi:hypothetical protein
MKYPLYYLTIWTAASVKVRGTCMWRILHATQILISKLFYFRQLMTSVQLIYFCPIDLPSQHKMCQIQGKIMQRNCFCCSKENITQGIQNRGVEEQLLSLLTTMLDGGDWSVTDSGHFTFQDSIPGFPL